MFEGERKKRRKEGKKEGKEGKKERSEAHFDGMRKEFNIQTEGYVRER